MKIFNSTLTVTGLMILILTILSNPVIAEEKYRVFETGESGEIIAFPAATEELLTDDIEIAGSGPKPPIN